MINYKDPVPPIIGFLNGAFDGRIALFGNEFSSGVKYPAVLVKSMGGVEYFRIQLLCRAETDIEAMAHLIEVMNYLEQYGHGISGIRVTWVGRESAPIPAKDEDTGIPEAWCYMRIEALEA